LILAVLAHVLKGAAAGKGVVSKEKATHSFKIKAETKGSGADQQKGGGGTLALRTEGWDLEKE